MQTGSHPVRAVLISTDPIPHCHRTDLSRQMQDGDEASITHFSFHLRSISVSSLSFTHFAIYRAYLSLIILQIAWLSKELSHNSVERAISVFTAKGEVSTSTLLVQEDTLSINHARVWGRSPFFKVNHALIWMRKFHCAAIFRK